jgi:hypothetical protein
MTHAETVRSSFWRPTNLTLPDWLEACVTTRSGGDSAPPYASLNLGLSTGDAPEVVGANRARVRAALGIDALPLHHLSQVHGDRIWAIPDPQAREGDGMWTATPGQVLAVGVADCVPAFVWDERTRRVALVHAGWRGTAAGILGGALRQFVATGARPADLRVSLGPCIGPCCYTVQADVASHFDPAAVRHEGATLHLDLRHANRLQAAAAGLAAPHIDAAPPCTGCNTETFFSHRRQGPRTGRMWALAWIRPGA